MIENNFLQPQNNSTAVLCHQYIDIVYQRVQESFVSTQSSDIVTQTNGEILYPSVDKILNYLAISENDIFYDLGSGFGKIILQVFLETKIKEAIGIEIVPEFFECSISARKIVETELPEFYSNNRKMSFILGDFLKVPCSNATIVMLNSICYSQPMLLNIVKKLNELKNIRYLISTRPLVNLKNLRLQNIIRVQCSWDSALCYLYWFGRNSNRLLKTRGKANSKKDGAINIS